MTDPTRRIVLAAALYVTLVVSIAAAYGVGMAAATAAIVVLIVWQAVEAALIIAARGDRRDH